MNNTVTISPQDILIRAQETPNPNALKFICNQSLKSVGNATFNSGADANDLPLVKSLFDIPGMAQVYLFQNTLTVTHEGDLDAEIIKEQVMAIMRTRIPVHNADFELQSQGPVQAEAKDRSLLSADMQKIEEVLDRTIRPGLQGDGGDVEVISFENNELKILYMGACGGCPSAMFGTLDAIQNILRFEMKNEEIMVFPI